MASVIPSALDSYSFTLHDGINHYSYGVPETDLLDVTFDDDLGTLYRAWDRSHIDGLGDHNMEVDASWYYYFRSTYENGGHAWPWTYSGSAITLNEIHSWMQVINSYDDQSSFSGTWYAWIYVWYSGDSSWTQVGYTAYSQFNEGTRYYELNVSEQYLTAPVEAIRMRQRFTGEHVGTVFTREASCSIYVGLREITASAPISASEFRVVGGDSDSTVYRLAEHDGFPDSTADDIQVRFGRDGTVHVLYLVDPSSESATPLRIQTPDGTRAVRKI